MSLFIKDHLNYLPSKTHIWTDVFSCIWAVWFLCMSCMCLSYLKWDVLNNIKWKLWTSNSPHFSKFCCGYGFCCLCFCYLFDFFFFFTNSVKSLSPVTCSYWSLLGLLSGQIMIVQEGELYYIFRDIDILKLKCSSTHSD